MQIRKSKQSNVRQRMNNRGGTALMPPNKPSLGSDNQLFSVTQRKILTGRTVQKKSILPIQRRKSKLVSKKKAFEGYKREISEFTHLLDDNFKYSKTDERGKTFPYNTGIDGPNKPNRGITKGTWNQLKNEFIEDCSYLREDHMRKNDITREDDSWQPHFNYLSRGSDQMKGFTIYDMILQQPNGSSAKFNFHVGVLDKITIDKADEK